MIEIYQTAAKCTLDYQAEAGAAFPALAVDPSRCRPAVAELRARGVSLSRQPFALRFPPHDEPAVPVRNADENGRRSGQRVAGQLSDGLVERILLPDLWRREGLTPDLPWRRASRNPAAPRNAASPWEAGAPERRF